MVAAHDVHGHFAQRDGFGWGVDAEELRRFFLEYEATIGFSSTFSAMLAAEAGVALGSGVPSGWDPYAKIVHKLTEAKATYRQLRRMDENGERGSVVVLYRLYGPRNGNTERTDFGKDAVAEIASLLAAYTDAASDARDQLVYSESTQREERTARLVARSQNQMCEELGVLFWREVTIAQKLEAELSELRRGGAAERAARVTEIDRDLLDAALALSDAKSRTARGRLESTVRRLTRERDRLVVAPEREQQILDRLAAGRILMGQIIEATSYDGTLRARLGAIESTDREITVEDAIRLMLDGPTKGRSWDGTTSWKDARAAFITAVRIEANQMRRRAHEAFRAAKDAGL